MSVIVIHNPGPYPLKAFVHGVPSGPGYGGMSPSDGDEVTSMVREYVIPVTGSESINVPDGAQLVVRPLLPTADYASGPSDGG